MGMHKICAICGKTSTLITPRNKLRGKYNPAAKKRKYPNLQWALLTHGLPAVASAKAGGRIKLCAKCLKTLSKTKK